VQDPWVDHRAEAIAKYVDTMRAAMATAGLRFEAEDSDPPRGAHRIDNGSVLMEVIRLGGLPVLKLMPGPGLGSVRTCLDMHHLDVSWICVEVIAGEKWS